MMPLDSASDFERHSLSCRMLFLQRHRELTPEDYEWLDSSWWVLVSI